MKEGILSVTTHGRLTYDSERKILGIPKKHTGFFVRFENKRIIIKKRIITKIKPNLLVEDVKSEKSPLENSCISSYCSSLFVSKKVGKMGI